MDIKQVQRIKKLVDEIGESTGSDGWEYKLGEINDILDDCLVRVEPQMVFNEKFPYANPKLVVKKVSDYHYYCEGTYEWNHDVIKYVSMACMNERYALDSWYLDVYRKLTKQ